MSHHVDHVMSFESELGSTGTTIIVPGLVMAVVAATRKDLAERAMSFQ